MSLSTSARQRLRCCKLRENKKLPRKDLVATRHGASGFFCAASCMPKALQTWALEIDARRVAFQFRLHVYMNLTRSLVGDAGRVQWLLHTRGNKPDGVPLRWRGLPTWVSIQPFLTMSSTLIARVIFQMTGYAIVTYSATTLGTVASAAHQVRHSSRPPPTCPPTFRDPLDLGL